MNNNSAGGDGNGNGRGPDNKQQNWSPMAVQIYWLIQNLLQINISNLNGSVKWIVNVFFKSNVYYNENKFFLI